MSKWKYRDRRKEENIKRKNRTKVGVCYRCNNKLQGNVLHCPSCLDRAKKRRRILWLKGLCACGKLLQENRKNCFACLLRSRLASLDISRAEKKRATEAVKSFNGSCSICGRLDSGTPRRDWAIDHDHTTKKFRAVICFGCNVGLGAMRDDPTVLRAAADYLEFHAGGS